MAKFVQITDFHLRPPGVLTLGTVDAQACAAKAVDRVLRDHGDVDAVLMTGDVTDRGEAEAYESAVSLLSRFSAPVVVIPGNHDRTGPLRRAFRDFPGFADLPLPDKASSAHRFGEVTVAALDTSVDGLDEGAGHGTLGADQLDWLDAVLGAAGPSLIAMHHPPFSTGVGFMDAIPLTDAADFAEIVARHDNVVRIVCGHVHRTIVGAVSGVPAIAVPGVAHQVLFALQENAVPQFIMEPPAFGVHLVDRTTTASHVAYVEDYGPPVSFADGARASAAETRS